MTTEIIAFNIEDACNMSVVIKDGELYPAYKVQSSIMAEYCATLKTWMAFLPPNCHF